MLLSVKIAIYDMLESLGYHITIIPNGRNFLECSRIKSNKKLVNRETVGIAPSSIYFEYK